MRWDELFRDLEAQLEAYDAAGLAGEVAERTRRERAMLRLVDRLRPATGGPVRLHVQGVGAVQGELVHVGAAAAVVLEAAGRQALVPLTAVLAVTGLGPLSAVPDSEGQVVARLGLAHSLRQVARDRAPVTVHLIDASTVTGTLDRVGSDFLELAEHAVGEIRRRDVVTGVRTVPFAAIGVVRSDSH